MAIVIDKPVQPFDEGMDVTRNNKDRIPFGKSVNTDRLNLSDEYSVPPAPQADPIPTPTPPVAPPAEVHKYSHKLADGTVLQAESFEALAAAIEQAISKQTKVETPQEFEDKPLYQPMEFKPKELSLTEQADILNLWKENPQKALAKLQEAQFGVPLEKIISNLSRAELRELNRMQEEAGVEFVMECENYSPTKANGRKLTEHLNKLGKPITKHNLVLSFQQLVAAGDKSLLRAEEPKTESAPATDPSLTEVPEPPAVIPSNQGRVETPAPGAVDVAKFASLTLAQQKEYFAKLKRQ